MKFLLLQGTQTIIGLSKSLEEMKLPIRLETWYGFINISFQHRGEISIRSKLLCIHMNEIVRVAIKSYFKSAL
jgi:hypothetical protein